MDQFCPLCHANRAMTIKRAMLISFTILEACTSFSSMASAEMRVPAGTTCDAMSWCDPVVIKWLEKSWLNILPDYNFKHSTNETGFLVRTHRDPATSKCT